MAHNISCAAISVDYVKGNEDTVTLRYIESNPDEIYKLSPEDGDSLKQRWLVTLNLLRKKTSGRANSRMERLALLPFEEFANSEREKDSIYRVRQYYLYRSCMLQGKFKESCKHYYEYVSPNFLSDDGELLEKCIVVFSQDQSCRDDLHKLEQLLLRKYSELEIKGKYFEKFRYDYYCVQPFYADFIIATTSNDSLREELLKLKTAYGCTMPSNNTNGVETKLIDWYTTLLNMYKEGDFEDRKSVDDIKREIDAYAIENELEDTIADVCAIEYLCYYALYQKSKDPGFDVRPYMQSCINIPTPVALQSFERNIATCFLSASNTLHKLIVYDTVMVVHSNECSISGIVFPEECSVTIDGKYAYCDKEGKFNRAIFVAEGGNAVNVVAKWSDGWIEKKTVSVRYSAEEPLKRAQNVALLFAIDNYKNQPLDFCIKHTESFAKALVDYGFDTIIIRNPTVEAFDSTLRQCALNFNKDLNEFSQLLVFFSGHGLYDTLFNIGSLSFIDGTVSYPDVAYRLDNINCNHILFIADACYSGSFFRNNKTKGRNTSNENIMKALKTKSRLGITSGNLEPVPDKSEFMQRIIQLFGEERKTLTFNDIVGCVDKVEPHPVSGAWGSNVPGGAFVFRQKRVDR